MTTKATVNHYEYSSKELNPRIQRNSASKWNYLVPGIATVAWTSFLISIPMHTDCLLYNYVYHREPISPEIIQLSRQVMVSLNLIGVATIPASFVATAIRAGYQGYLKVSDGVAIAAQTVFETIQESCSSNSFSRPEGIIINTIAAPFVVAEAIFSESN